MTSMKPFPKGSRVGKKGVRWNWCGSIRAKISGGFFLNLSSFPAFWETILNSKFWDASSFQGCFHSPWSRSVWTWMAWDQFIVLVPRDNDFLSVTWRFGKSWRGIFLSLVTMLWTQEPVCGPSIYQWDEQMGGDSTGFLQRDVFFLGGGLKK